MNYGMIRYIVGKMLLIEGFLLLFPAFVSFLYGEMEGISFLLTAMLLLLVSFLGSRKPENTAIYAKEGFLIVALAWVLWSVFGALPFLLSGCIPRFEDAFFEVVSGFTHLPRAAISRFHNFAISPPQRPVHALSRL